MWKRLESIVGLVLALAAVAIAIVTVRREFSGGAPSATVVPLLDTKPVESWDRIVGTSMPLIPGDDRVHIVEFTDLECPACRQFHVGALNVALEGLAFAPSFSVVHFPLRGHRFARIAATAAECAGAQGRGRAFVDAVFARQDSIGLAAWSAYAVVAGVPDTATFNLCVSAGPSERVIAGEALAEELGLRETPTIFINGRRLSRPPSGDELRALVAAQSRAGSR